MYMDVMKNVSLQALGTTLSSILMIAVLTAAPILTKKWDLVSIIRVCLLGGFIACVTLTAYVVMVPDFIQILFVIWMALGNGLITMSVQM